MWSIVQRVNNVLYNLLASVFELPHFLSSCWLWAHNGKAYQRLGAQAQDGGAGGDYTPPKFGMDVGSWEFSKPPVVPKVKGMML